MITNELLLYGGLIVAGTAAALAVVTAVVFVLEKKKLEKKFNAEYGEKIKNK